jgi:GDP-L-fucose synthase
MVEGKDRMKNKRIMVTGGNGFLGRRIVKQLVDENADVFIPYSDKYDLRNLSAIRAALDDFRPEIVIHAAATAGGIGLNQARPADLFYNNAIMGIQLMDSAYKRGVEKFVQIGTVCEYPQFPPIPFREEDIWDGYPEPTNAPYGLAKKMLLVQGQAYRQQYGFNVIHLLPVNLYGPADNFNPNSSHVIPALIAKIASAKRNNFSQVNIWGSGLASREFLHVDDAARAIVLATKEYNEGEPVNIGSGKSITIEALSALIAGKIGYEGRLIFDTSKPDGQWRRQLDVSKALKLFNFIAEKDFDSGLEETIAWYKENYEKSVD